MIQCLGFSVHRKANKRGCRKPSRVGKTFKFSVMEKIGVKQPIEFNTDGVGIRVTKGENPVCIQMGPGNCLYPAHAIETKCEELFKEETVRAYFASDWSEELKSYLGTDSLSGYFNQVHPGSLLTTQEEVLIGKSFIYGDDDSDASVEDIKWKLWLTDLPEGNYIMWQGQYEVRFFNGKVPEAIASWEEPKVQPFEVTVFQGRLYKISQRSLCVVSRNYEPNDISWAKLSDTKHTINDNGEFTHYLDHPWMV